jgi:Co/Zn/Cd efflux system component
MRKWSEPELTAMVVLVVALVCLVVGLSAVWLLAAAAPAIAEAYGRGVSEGAAIVSQGVAGAVAGGLVSTLVIPVVTAAVSVVIPLGVAVVVVRKVLPQFNDHSYEWVLSALAVFAAFVVDISREFAPLDIQPHELGKVIFAGITSAFFLFGGILWKRKAAHRRQGVVLKFLATLLFLFSPAWIVTDRALKCRGALGSCLGDASIWVSVAVLILILVIAAAFARILDDPEAPGHRDRR